MAKLHPSLLSRAFGEVQQKVDVTLTVERLSWAAVGGCQEATIRAAGDETALFLLFDQLRSPVEIYDDYGVLVWWGFLNGVEGQFRSMSVGYSLDEMANALAVQYSYVAPGSTAGGVAARTPGSGFTPDAKSVAIYGTKEMQLSIDGVSHTEAANYLAAQLALRRLPRPQRPQLQRGNPSAVLTCRGWFSTLGWRHYAQAGTVSTETTAQITTIEANVGDFLTGVRLANTSGVFSSQWRDGNGTAREEIEKLLGSGTTNNRLLYARVTPARLLEVYEEPVSTETTDLLITPEQRFQNAWHETLPKTTDITGQWFRPWQVWPGLSVASYVAPIGPFFVDGMTYDATSDTQSVTIRGDLDPWLLFAARR